MMFVNNVAKNAKMGMGHFTLVTCKIHMQRRDKLLDVSCSSIQFWDH